MKHVNFGVLALGWALMGCSSTNEVASGATGDTGKTTVPYKRGSTFGDDCGKTTFHDIMLTGGINALGGQPATGATVALQDFTFQPPQVLGSTSSSAGSFTFDVQRLKSIEDCWGNGRLDYRIVGTLDDTRAEERINNAIFNAIFGDDANKVVDLSALPLQLE
ncbi:MAG: hypothetical protein AAGA48_23360 [Myxococcota bacterium]